MTSIERAQVEVAVAVVTDPNQRVLLVLNEPWGMFTLPMTKRRRGRLGNEPMARAALRAGVEAMGVPARLVEGEHRRLSARIESGRQRAERQSVYEVFHVEPHADFADRASPRVPHLWLSPHLALSGRYEPISESARVVLREVLAAFAIPARVQRTSVLILRRDDPERGRQFLVRQNPDWGYSLPAKRWEPAESAGPESLDGAALAAAERVAREELGLEPGPDVTIAPARSPEFTTHGVSATTGAPALGAETDYRHRLFDARTHHGKAPRSDRPLAWVTAEEIHRGWTEASHGESGTPERRPGPVSRTTCEIMRHLGLIPEADDPEVDAAAEAVIARMSRRFLNEFGGMVG